MLGIIVLRSVLRLPARLAYAERLEVRDPPSEYSRPGFFKTLNLGAFVELNLLKFAFCLLSSSVSELLKQLSSMPALFVSMDLWRPKIQFILCLTLFREGFSWLRNIGLLVFMLLCLIGLRRVLTDAALVVVSNDFSSSTLGVYSSSSSVGY